MNTMTIALVFDILLVVSLTVYLIRVAYLDRHIRKLIDDAFKISLSEIEQGEVKYYRKRLKEVDKVVNGYSKICFYFWRSLDSFYDKKVVYTIHKNKRK